MSAQKVFVETSVALKVGTSHLPEDQWQAVVQHLAPTCQFVVSPLTFFEVLNSLASGDENYIVPNLRRLRVLSPDNPAGPRFLEMPGQFALRVILGCGPISGTYQPVQLEEAMATVLEQVAPTRELRAWLADVNCQLRIGKDSFVSTYEKDRTSPQTGSERESWARAHLEHLGIILPTPEELEKFSRGLNAAIAYETSLRRQLKNPGYFPVNDDSSWIDSQQLFYLCDPNVHMLYLDRDFETRVEDTTQRSQLFNVKAVLQKIAAAA